MGGCTHPLADAPQAAGMPREEGGRRRPNAARRILLGAALLLWVAWMAFLVSLAVWK